MYSCVYCGFPGAKFPKNIPQKHFDLTYVHTSTSPVEVVVYYCSFSFFMKTILYHFVHINLKVRPKWSSFHDPVL